MKNTFTLALILAGSLLILGPVAISGYFGGRDKDRVAEFYKQNSNSAVLPEALRPTSYSTYEYSSFVFGALMIGTGTTRSHGAVVL